MTKCCSSATWVKPLSASNPRASWPAPCRPSTSGTRRPARSPSGTWTMTAGVRARTRRLWSPGRGTTAHGSPTGPTGAAATLRVAGAEDVVELPPPHAATVSVTSTTAAPRMGATLPLRTGGDGLRRRDHARAHGVVRGLVDEDERAGGAVVGVGVEGERLGGAQSHPADVVEGQLRRRRLAAQGAELDAILERLDDRARRVRGVLDRVAPAGAQRGVGHPAHVGGQVAGEGRAIAGAADEIAARHVELVGQADRDAHGRDSRVQRAIERVDRGDRARALGGEHEDLVAGAQHAAGDLPRVAAVVALAVADDVLDGEAQLGQVAVGLHLDRLEVLE